MSQANGNGTVADTLAEHRNNMGVFQNQLQAVLMAAPQTATVPEIVGVLTFFAHNMTINARLMQEQMSQQAASPLIVPR